ncbi:MAG TPA: oligosaccharide flippase family protein [Allosphingosinicella sp.]
MYNVIGMVLPVAVTLLTVPLYLETVGIERYGVLAVCWVLLGYLGFLDLGLAPAVAQKIASAKDEEAGGAQAIFWTAAWVSIAAGILSALLFYAGAAVYFAAGAVKSSFNGEIRAAVPLLGLLLPVGMLSSVGAGALQARERFLALNVINVTSSTLMSVLPLLVAYTWSPTLEGLVAGSLAARFIGLVLLFANCFAAVPLSRVLRPRKDLTASLLKFGGWMTISTAVAPLLVTVDRLAIGGLLGAAAVAAYSIPFSLIARMPIISIGISAALFPRFAAATDLERKRLMTLAIAAIVGAMTPICIVVIALVEPFFTLWVGPRLATISAPVACFLVIGAWANGIAYIPMTKLQGSGQPDIVAKIHLSELVPYWLTLAGSLYFFGLAGAAVAWSLRCTADCMLLYWQSRIGFSSLYAFLIPFLLVLVALLAALALGSPERWAVWAATFSLACLWTGYNLPDALRDKLGALGRVLPRRHLQG